MRLIDADDFKDKIQSCDRYVLSPVITSVMLHMIGNQPTVEAEPVKHGRWIDHEMFERNNCNPCIECSVCNTWFGCDCFPKTKFCPNCGAKLIKDGDSE